MSRAQLGWLPLPLLVALSSGCGGSGAGSPGPDVAGAGGAMTGGAMTGGTSTGGAMTGGTMTGGAMTGGASVTGGSSGAPVLGGAAGDGPLTGGTGAFGGATAGGAGEASGGTAAEGGAAGAGGNEAPGRRVLLVIFEPLSPVSSLPLWEDQSYADPEALTASAVDWWAEVSEGRLRYELVETLRIPAFPVKADGHLYDYAGWEGVIAAPETAHQPDSADYDAIIAQTQLCERVNAGQVDELWMFGGPYFGFAESALAGPGGFAYNGPSFADNACERLVPIMGFSYERGLPEMLEDFGHRAEATMTQVFGGWQEDRMSHDWDRFGLVAAQSPSFGYSGCGSVHYPPNALADYQYDRVEATSSYCDAFLAYPALPADLAASATPVGCAAWGCTQEGYFRYWFGHLPHATGTTDGVANDWWRYFIDPNLARGCDALTAEECGAESRCALLCGACYRAGVDATAACSPCGLERTLVGCDAHGGCAWYSCPADRVNCWPTGTDPAIACAG